jgi:PKD repeat protein
MRKNKGIPTWVVVVGLGVTVLMTLACSGKSTNYPTQPPARNLTVPVVTTFVVASFDATQAAGDPFTYGFQDTSTGGPTGWRWSFGDGGAKRGVQTVVHTYKKPGLYAVTLTVSNPISQDSATQFLQVGEAEAEEVVEEAG